MANPEGGGNCHHKTPRSYADTSGIAIIFEIKIIVQ